MEDKNAEIDDLARQALADYHRRGMRLWMLLSSICAVVGVAAGKAKGCSESMVGTVGFSLLALVIAMFGASGILRVSVAKPKSSPSLLGFGLAIGTHAPITLIGFLLTGDNYLSLILSQACGFAFFIWSLFVIGPAWGIVIGFQRRRLFREN